MFILFPECTFASLPRTTRGMPIVIAGSPDGKKFLYCNGNSVYIRDVEVVKFFQNFEFDLWFRTFAIATFTPSILCWQVSVFCFCSAINNHFSAVAKYAPSGFYIASGDQSGKLRIWDTTQSTHILKDEYPVISGPIRDIAWSEDSKRIAVVGEGRERWVFIFGIFWNI